MTTQPTNFLEYLGSQENNLLVSLQNFRQEFDLFGNVDTLYQAVLRRLTLPDNGLRSDDAVIGQLLAFEHNHFYLGMSLLLRTHLSDGYHSLRTAIDASLIAYRLILKDGTPEDYLNRANSFTVMARYIRGKRNNDPTAYPLAENLLKLLDYCSQYASHADFSVFFHRLRTSQTGNQTLIEVGYFQHVNEVPLHQMMLLTFLDAHLCILGIYESFLLDKGLVDGDWVKARNELGSVIVEGKAQLREVLKTQPVGSIPQI